MMENNKESSNKNLSTRKNAMRPKAQRLSLEPRIVFDAVLPVMGAEALEHSIEHATPTEAPHIEAPAVAANTNETASTSQEKQTVSDNTGDRAAAEVALADRPLIEGTLAPANLTSHEIIFIDAIVADLQQYIIDHPNADVVLLDSSKDALDQIAAVLNGRTDISAIHILSHGSSGELQIGNEVLNLQNLTSGSHVTDLAIIKSAMAEDGDILIYGCDVGAGANGQAFIDALAANTGADIAASTDTTGAAEAFGGDWNLEVHTATIEAKALQLTDWQGQLVFSNTSSGTAWTFTNAAANGGTAATITTASNTTDGVTTTVTLGGPANAWTGTAVQTLNNIAAFANGAAGTADFVTNFNSASAAGVTGTVTITFSKPVINPIIHIDRIGGTLGTTSNSSLWTLTTAGATLTKLAGTGSLLVGGASANGSTGTTFERQSGINIPAAPRGESSLTNNDGTAAGSMQVTGTYTTLTFNVTGPSDGLELAFAFDAPPVTNNDAFSINEDTTLTGNLFANNGSGVDVDARGDAFKVNAINGAAFTVGTPISLANGILTITNDTTGAFTFVPNANYNGVQTFTYDVKEVSATGLPLPGTGIGNVSNTATASITISAVNDPPLVDLNSNVIPQQIITNGANPGAANWTGVGGAIGNGGYYFSADNSTGTLTQTAISGWNIGSASSGSAVLSFDFGWNNGTPDTAIPATADISVGGVVYARITSGVSTSGAPNIATITYLNGATGSTTSVATSTYLAWTPTNISINLPANPAAGDLKVSFNSGANGSDDFWFDNFSANTLVDAVAGNDFATTYAENGVAVSVASPLDSVRDIDSTNMQSGLVTLTNPQTGDRLLVNGSAAASGILPGGISYTRTDTAVTFTGSGTKADYAAAIRAVQFDNTTENPSTINRVINTKVNDGAADSNIAVTTITVTAVNDAPVNTVPATQTTLEDTAIVFSSANGNAIQISDVDAGSSLVTVTIWAENGLLTLASTAGLTFSTTTNNGSGTDTAVSTGTNDATIRVTGTVTAINAALNGLTFKPTANSNGDTAIGPGTGVGKISIRTEDNGNTGTGGNLTDTDSVTINITTVKDTTVDNVNTNEDTPITISPLTNDSFGAGNVFLTGVTAPSHGTAVVNAGAGTTTYTPTANYNGTDSYTYTTTTIDAGFKYEFWTANQPDGSTYASTFTGGFPATAANGTGWTAGISGTDGIRIQEQQNDADVSLTARWSGVVLIEKTGTYTFSLNADNAARLLIDGNPVVAVGWADGTLTGTITGLSAGVHTFQLEYADTAINQNVNLSYSGLDTGGATVNVNNDKHWGAAARTETETINITVNNVNDAPSGTDNLNVAGAEDTPVTITTANFGFSDTNDTPANIFANVIITSLPPATEGVYKLNGSNIAINQIISIAQIDAGLLKFVPANGVNGNDLGALGFKVQDNGGVANGGVNTDTTANTLAIDIAAVDDAPVGTDNTFDVLEEGSHTFTLADFGFSDPNDTPPHAFAKIIITTLPATGTLTLAGAPVSAGQIIPVAAIGDLVWTASPELFGIAVASFDFQVVDDSGDNLVVNGSLEAVPFTSPSTAFAAYNAMTPPAASQTSPPELGGWNRLVTTRVVGATTQYTMTAMSLVRDDDAATTDTPYGNQAGFRAEVWQTISGLNPGDTYTVSGDSIVNTIGTRFQLVVFDANAFDGTRDFTNGLPANIGSQTLAGSVNGVSPNWRNLSYNFVAPASGSIDVLVIKSSGGGGAPCSWDNISVTPVTPKDTDLSPNTITFNVTPVNDAPVDGNETNTVTEDIVLTVADGGTGDLLNNATDVDGNPLSITGYTIAGIAGTQAVNVPVVIAGIGTVTINANGSYSFAPAANYDGAIPLITYTVSDGTLTDTSTLTLSITPVNDVPVDGDETNTLTEDTTLTVADGSPGDLLNNATDTEGNPLTISGFTIAGVAGFQAVNTPVLIAGVGTITINANGSYSFTPAANYTGGIPLITYSVNDGAGGIDTSTLGLSITAVNDAPAGNDNTSTVNEDTVYTVKAADFGFTDPNDTVPNTLANVIITSLPTDGSGQYQLNGLPIAINQVISAADINAGLLKFVPTPNFNGNGTAALGFQVQDNGGTALGGADTDPTPNTFRLNITPVNDTVTYGSLTDNSANVPNTDAQVFEKDLPIGSTPSGTGEVVNGSFTLGPITSLTSFTLGGASSGAITAAQLLNSGTTPITRVGTYGTLVINGYNASTSVVNYTYTLTNRANHTAGIVNEVYGIATTDVEGDINNTNSLRINIVDDNPIAKADTDEVVNLGGTADGNVLTGTGGTDSNNSDGIADLMGADGAAAGSPSPVTGVAAGTGAPIAGNLGGAGVAGAYGTLVLNQNGSYVYTPSASNPTVTGLAPGATLTDTFTYSIKDSDGDTATTTLTITIVGVPSVTGLGDGTVAGTDGSVLESDLAAGTNAAGTGETLNSSFILNAPSGVQTLSIKPTGQAAVVLTLLDLNALSGTPRTFTTANGTLTLKGFNAGTGQVNYTYTLTTPANSSGSPTDDFEVILRDNSPNGGVATVPQFLKIAIIDDAPIANPDTANINENSTDITGNVVTASDLIGADGPTGTNNPVTGVIAGTGTPTGSVGSAVAGSYGSITLAADGSYTYTLNNANATVNALNVGQSLTESFTYKITDKDGDVSTTTLTITIDGVNDAPVVNPDTATTLEDTPVSGNVLTNDSDVDSTLTVTQFTIAGVAGTFNAGDTATIPGVGTLTIGATGGYTFTPVAGYNGTVPVATYTVNDGSGQPNATASSTLALTVTSVNDAPQGANSTVATNEDTPVSLNTGNFGFSDPNDTLANTLQSVIITTLPTTGTLKLSGVAVTAGQTISAANIANLTWTPALNANGAGISSFTFQVVDNGGTANGGQNTDQSPNTITFDVTSVNDAPAGADKTVTINEDQAYLVTAADFGFTDANDSPANSLANIIITALPPGTQGAYLLNGNPVNLGDVISVADINSGLFSFNPVANLNGNNLGSLGFKVQDDGGTANGGVNTDPTANTLKFNITSVNDVPVATDDNVTTNEDTPVTLNLLGNDTDADGDTLSIKSINGVAITPGTAQTITVPNGQVNVSAAGVVTFVPNPNYFGPVTFDYVVQDGKGGEDTGTVNVTVTSVNDKPAPAVDVTSTPEDTPVSGNVLTNDTDADNVTLNVTQFTIPGVGTFTAGQTAAIPGKGTLTIDNLGNYTFTPALNFNGALPVVTYTLTDNSGAANQTATSTLSLTVTPVNDAPVATPINPSGNEDTPIPVSLAGTDVDGTVVSVTVTALPPVTEGILYLADGTTPVDINSPLTPAQAAGLIFKPAPNFNGSVTPITFTVKDNQGLDSAPASANITIAPVIDLPVAISGSTNTLEDVNATVSLTATDVDGTIASIRVTVLPSPAEGVLYYADGITPVLLTDIISPADAASLIFNPAANFNGLVNVKFTALDNDGNLSANVGNFLIDVADVNDAPIATPTTVNGTEDVTANVSLTGTDIDGTVTKVTVDSLPPVTQGILYLADGVTPVVAGQPLTPAQAANLKFDPAPNFNGTVTIPFTVTDDDNELSTPANLIINIGAVNDAPDANPDTQTVAEDTPASGNVIANDTDAEGSTLNVTQFNVPGVGTVTAGTTATIPGVGTILITANGDYTFTPVLNFNGNVPTITYTVSDGVNSTNTTLNITVTSVNDPPVALATSPTGNEDTPIPVKLLGTDVDGTIASVTITSLPPATDGILTFANGTPVPAGTAITPAQAAGLIFVPAPNFNGIVTIPFTVTDNQGATSSTADAVITVVPVNDPPIATPTIATGNEDTPIPLNLTGTDVEGPIASVTVTSLPPATQGILTLADGTPVVAGVPLTPAQAAGLIFTPAPNFNGTLNIPFKVTDADGTTSTPANATINVVSVNDPPVAIAGSVNTPEDANVAVKLKGTDVDGTVTSITVTSLPDPSQGVLTFANGSPVIANVPMTPAQAAGLIFNPTANYNGVVTVLFTATDNLGAVSTPASFVIDVAAVDDDPTATPTSPSGPEDTPLPVSLTGTDVEGPITAVTVVSLPPASQGILTKADGTPVVAGQPLTPTEAANLIFVPAPNFNGSVNIPFTVTDSVGQVSSPPTIAALTIVPVNDLPVAIPSTPSGNEDTPIPVRLTGTDIDGTVTKVTILTPPSNGTLTLNGVPVVAGQVLTPAQAASLVFNPAPNFVGTVNVVFTVTDNNNGESPPATTTITVNDVVSPPVGNPTTVSGSSESIIAVPLTGSDTDGTIASVTVVALPPASLGVLTLADGTPVVAGVPLTPAQAAGLIFKPTPGSNGNVSILFTVTDDEGLVSSPATATIVVEDLTALFEQLLSPPAKINSADPNRPDPFALRTPVIPIGMPEDLFVSHSVRESQNVVAQSNGFGLFNTDTPSTNELNAFTFDLKGLPIGMDPHLYVQHAVRSLPVTTEPNLFVQNAVRQSQTESMARNIGVTSFNSATSGVTSLMSPFSLGSPNDEADLIIDGVQGEFNQATNAADEDTLATNTIEKSLAEKVTLIDSLIPEQEEVVVLPVKHSAQQQVAAASFANQLGAAANRYKTNNLFNKQLIK